MQLVNTTMNKKYGNYPEKILQFGEGNFLRAFADWMIDEANERGDYQGSIVLCQPIDGGEAIRKMMNDQDGIYTLVMRGLEDGSAVEKSRRISSVSRCINAYADYEALMDIARSEELEVVISNTTEAGIAYREGDTLDACPPASFPAKVCVFLYERYKAFNGAADKGLLFLPVELIDDNGTRLKEIIIRYAKEWELEEAFIDWINQANHFTNTLVDRIVTGYPRNEIAEFEEKLGYRDQVLVTSEVFNLWVIEGKKEWADILPIHKGQANVIWTEDVRPYKMRKVKILNGGHTATVLGAYLSGHDYVLQVMEDPLYNSFLKKLFAEEVIPTIDLPKEELDAFAAAVLDRFSNPYIKHSLLDISLNSCAKFNARCLPSLLNFIDKMEALPLRLIWALSAFIRFYKGELLENGYVGTREDGTQYTIRDDEQVIRFFAKAWKDNDNHKAAHQILANREFWSGRDLTETAGLEAKVCEYLDAFDSGSVKDLLKELV